MNEFSLESTLLRLERAAIIRDRDINVAVLKSDIQRLLVKYYDLEAQNKEQDYLW